MPMFESRGMESPGRADPKPVLPQEKHERNAEVVVLASNIQHVWHRQISLLLRNIRQHDVATIGPAAVLWSRKGLVWIRLPYHNGCGTFS
jgi:hypothetical protein